MRTYNLFPLIGLSLLIALIFFLMSCSKKTDVDVAYETTTEGGIIQDTNTVYITRDTVMHQSTPPAGSTMNTQDLQFVRQALVGNKGEVELGMLALTKASAANVRSFAQMMVDDHSKVFDELVRMATAKQLILDTAATTEQKQTQKKLMALSGKSFDKEYIRVMVSDHEKARDLFQLETAGGGDEEIKAFARKHLPGIMTHLQHARGMDTVALSAVH